MNSDDVLSGLTALMLWGALFSMVFLLGYATARDQYKAEAGRSPKRMAN